MAKWTAFPHDANAYHYDLATLKKKWARLHAGDAEPLPADEKVLAAWQLFHAGEFQKATEAGLKAHGAGIAGAMTVANKSQAIYATYLEASEKNKLALLLEVAERAEKRAARCAQGSERLVLHGVRARPLQPGHQHRQSARARARRRR